MIKIEIALNNGYPSDQYELSLPVTIAIHENNDNKAVTMAGDSPTKVEEKKKEDPIAATDYIDVKAEAYHAPENKTVAKRKEVQTTRTNQVNKPRKKNNVEESDALDFNNSLYEDTLGTGIWKNEKNVSIAMELLKDCEKSIGLSHKAIRNGVVEASFNALPHSPNMQLVIDEEGNYVITEKTQPSPVRLWNIHLSTHNRRIPLLKRTQSQIMNT